MEFRVQTGRVEDDRWVQGEIDLPLIAIDPRDAKLKAPYVVLISGVWIEGG